MTTTATDPQLREFTTDELKSLVAIEHDCCISLYMPTHRKGSETQQDPIRLKNLVTQLEKKLDENGQTCGAIAELHSLTNNALFWQHQGQGLAIFIAGDDVQMFRLPFTVEADVQVGSSMNVHPLVNQRTAEGDIYLLSISWQHASLSRIAAGSNVTGDAATVVETSLLPATFDELITPRDPEETLQSTSTRRGGTLGGQATATFHGHGEGEGKINADRVHYLKLIGREVAGVMYGQTAPLILHATTEVIGHFEKSTDVKYHATVTGSPDEPGGQDAVAKAKAAAEPILKSTQDDLVETFGTAAAGGTASSDPADIHAAAKEGRVKRLMIVQDCPTDDTLNQTIAATITNSGDVISIPANDNLPAGAHVMAIYRY